jgi:hypothetical protein
MGKNSNIAFIIGIAITGGSLITFPDVQLQIGVGLLVFLAIWIPLTVPSWGALRKKWDSRPVRWLVIEDWGEHKLNEGVTQTLGMQICLRSMPPSVVSSVQLEIKGKRFKANFEPTDVGDIAHVFDISFVVPKELIVSGKRAKIVAFAHGKYWYSEEFSIELAS